MEIVLIKQTLANGLASPESIQLERNFRASGFWSQVGDKQITLRTPQSPPQGCTAPALLVKDGEKTELFTDVSSFELYSQAKPSTSSNPEAACW